MDSKHSEDGSSTLLFDPHQGLHGGSSETFLFQRISTSGVNEFLFACFILAIVAFGLEVVRYYMSKLENEMKLLKEESHKLITSPFGNTYSTMENSGTEENGRLKVTPTLSSSSNEANILQKTSLLRVIKNWATIGALYSSTYLVSIMLMLIAMTYNIYLILSMCVGFTAGKLLCLCLRCKAASK